MPSVRIGGRAGVCHAPVVSADSCGSPDRWLLEMPDIEKEAGTGGGCGIGSAPRRTAGPVSANLRRYYQTAPHGQPGSQMGMGETGCESGTVRGRARQNPMQPCVRLPERTEVNLETKHRIDVYAQLRANWERFSDYVWKEGQK